MWSNNNCIAFLSIFIQNNPIKSELFAIINLVAYKIEKEYGNSIKDISTTNKSSIRLSKKQVQILQLMARGFTEYYIAREMKLSYGTVKYHKQKIFSSLKAECSIEAVIKAMKYNILSMEQIDIG